MSASHVWPNVFRGNEVVWHSTTHNWRLAVDNSILGEELLCSFTMRAQNCSFSVGLGTQSNFLCNEVARSLKYQLRALVDTYLCSKPKIRLPALGR